MPGFNYSFLIIQNALSPIALDYLQQLEFVGRLDHARSRHCEPSTDRAKPGPLERSDRSRIVDIDADLLPLDSIVPEHLQDRLRHPVRYYRLCCLGPLPSDREPDISI